MSDGDHSSQSPFTPPSAVGDDPPPSPLLRLARFAGVDRAVLLAMLSRLWQLLTGPVTQLLIALNFSSAVRNYYAVFTTLLGMQVFVELGLHAVLINLASREWAGLSVENGEVTGDLLCRNRLSALTRLMNRWYLSVAVAFVLGLLTFGAFFLKSSGPSDVSWAAPWIVVVLLNGVQLCLLPRTSILEGCHQMVALYRTRFWQGIVGSVVVWAAVAGQLGLWALAGSALVRVLGDWYLVRVRYGRFFSSLTTDAVSGERSSLHYPWRTEVLPLQWRTAIQGVLTWAASQLPVLVVFKAFPASGDAGRLGMTWTVLTALQSATMALVETRRPLFGSLIARRDFPTLNHLFLRYARNSVAALVLLLILYSATIGFVGLRSEWLAVRISQNFLSFLPTLVFCGAFVAYQYVMCIGIYVRAHRIEPFLMASVVSCIVISSLEFWFGLQHGALGVACGYAIGVIGVMLPLYLRIWFEVRASGDSKTAPGDDLNR